ncbi:hypothetical protein, partial [uncultured Acidaminococcus sp.]|uniref:hypothetical protein n=1 Tax=uncultured Acidaminococcus sp. TaxID=352152 RepID=UPI00258F811B
MLKNVRMPFQNAPPTVGAAGPAARQCGQGAGDFSLPLYLFYIRPFQGRKQGASALADSEVAYAV